MWESKDDRKWGHDKFEEMNTEDRHPDEVILFLLAFHFPYTPFSCHVQTHAAFGELSMLKNLLFSCFFLLIIIIIREGGLLKDCIVAVGKLEVESVDMLEVVG